MAVKGIEILIWTNLESEESWEIVFEMLLNSTSVLTGYSMQILNKFSIILVSWDYENVGIGQRFSRILINFIHLKSRKPGTLHREIALRKNVQRLDNFQPM